MTEVQKVGSSKFSALFHYTKTEKEKIIQILPFIIIKNCLPLRIELELTSD